MRIKFACGISLLFSLLCGGVQSQSPTEDIFSGVRAVQRLWLLHFD